LAKSATIFYKLDHSTRWAIHHICQYFIRGKGLHLPSYASTKKQAFKLDSESSDSSSHKSELEPLPQTRLKLGLRLDNTVTIELNAPDPKKFPLLQSLGYYSINMDQLMQEIILFHVNNQITFMHRNNQNGSLIILLLHWYFNC
jgi:hypothetical protein